MTNRRKKRRRGRAPAGNGTRGTAQRRAAVERERAEDRASREVPAPAPAAEKPSPRRAPDPVPPRPRGLFGARFREPSPYPGFVDSVGRGLGAVASSPPAFVIGFLSLLVLWVAYVALGAADLMSPRAMAALLTVPPLHILLNDRVLAFFPVVGDSVLGGLGVAVALSLFRGVVLGAVVALVARRLGWTGQPVVRAWARAIPALLLISLAFFGLAAAVPYVFAGVLPGNLAGILLLAGPLLGLYFLVFAPVVAVVEGAGYRDAIRRSARAARLPGGAHITLTFGYFALTLFLVSAIPARVVEPATPTVLTWAIAMAATFLHLGVMGAFVYRWLLVRERVDAAPAPRTERTSGRGLLR